MGGGWRRGWGQAGFGGRASPWRSERGIPGARRCPGDLVRAPIISCSAARLPAFGFPRGSPALWASPHDGFWETLRVSERSLGQSWLLAATGLTVCEVFGVRPLSCLCPGDPARTRPLSGPGLWGRLRGSPTRGTPDLTRPPVSLGWDCGQRPDLSLGGRSGFGGSLPMSPHVRTAETTYGMTVRGEPAGDTVPVRPGDRSVSVGPKSRESRFPCLAASPQAVVGTRQDAGLGRGPREPQASREGSPEEKKQPSGGGFPTPRKEKMLP